MHNNNIDQGYRNAVTRILQSRVLLYLVGLYVCFGQLADLQAEALPALPDSAPQTAEATPQASQETQQTVESSASSDEKKSTPSMSQNASQMDSDLVRVQVAEPYIEMHTGPGRGYPVYHVVERHQWVSVIKRKTDWFKVISGKGKIGWVYIDDIQLTLTAPGVQARFPHIKQEHFEQRDFEIGAQAGSFEGASLMSVYAGLLLNDNLSTDLSITQATGTFTNSVIIALNLVSTPFPKWSITPTFALGIGHLRRKPRETFLLAEETSDVVSSVGLGLKTYISRRFVFRADARYYIAHIDDEDNGEFNEWKLGFSFFY